MLEHIFGDLLIALFAAFGVYAALHLLLALCLASPRLGVVIRVLTPADAANVDFLLLAARVNGCFSKIRRPVALVSHTLSGDRMLLQKLAEHRAEIHYI